MLLSYDPDEDDATAWGGYGPRVMRGSSALALSSEPDPQLMRAAEKNRLKPALRSELARRLRREAPEAFLPGAGPVAAAPGGGPAPQRWPGPLRVFRFALDDLRLYQAVHEAGMEGHIVVVDDPERAHVVLATRRTRTGRDVPTSDAKRLAQRLGVPFVELERISGLRLMQALSPIMGLPMPSHLLEPKVPRQPVLRVPELVAREAIALRQALRVPPVPAPSPSLSLPAQGQWQQAGAEGAPAWSRGSAAGLGLTIGELLGQAPVPASLDETSFVLRPPGAGASPPSSGGGADGAAVAAAVEGMDVHDRRTELLPANPTERLGERHRIARPIKHGRRVRLRRELRWAANHKAAW